MSEQLPDYYEVLEISPTAHQETIAAVHQHLVRQHQPNPDRCREINEAFAVVGNPASRREYDQQYRVQQMAQRKILESAHPSDDSSLDAERQKRVSILTLLRAKRLQAPNLPVLNVVQLEQLLGIHRDKLELSLWYLRETGRLSRADNGLYALTPKGLEMLEEYLAENPSAASQVPPLTPTDTVASPPPPVESILTVSPTSSLASRLRTAARRVGAKAAI